MDSPSRIGKYELLDYLGGGMSRVYKARDTLIGRIVCVKILLSEKADEDTKARFLQEARVAGNLNHDNVIRVYDFGEDDGGNPFMVMEFLEGDDLRHLMKQGRTGDLDWKLKTALQIARALDHIHERRIIHRDIKPENIHLTKAGVVKLMDFGIAKSEDVSLTRTGFTLGTPYYMSPEQVRGEPPTVLMDIYAYGVMLFEILTGIRPTEGETIETIFFKILYNPLDLAPLVATNAPEPVRDLVARCTSKDPAQRPQSFAEICTVLERVLGDKAPRVEHAAPPPSAAAAAPPAHSAGTPGAMAATAVAGAGAPTSVATPPSAPAYAASGVATPGAVSTGAPAPAAKKNLTVIAASLLVGLIVLVVVIVVLARQKSSDQGAQTAQTAAQQAPLAPTIDTPTGQMLLVPAGKYLAGKDAAPVEVPAFYVDKTEVTNAQYARFCQERGRPLPEGFAADKPDYPVVNITYVDADLFAKWAGKRLPTMDEWEKAARGDGGRPYPWGQDADGSKAVLGAKQLAPVGSIAAGASPYGAVDMLGNVWEFVSDPRTPTPGALNAFKTLVTPLPTATEPWFAMRGGSYRTPLDAALIWDSASVPARFKGADIGFRCVRDSK